MKIFNYPDNFTINLCIVKIVFHSEETLQCQWYPAGYILKFENFLQKYFLSIFYLYNNIDRIIILWNR